MSLAANARMYSVDAVTRAHWRALLEWVIARAGVDACVIDHPAPAPLSALWRRADLGCAFMCGYPLTRTVPPPTVLAAPVPSPRRYGGRAVYWSDLVVRSDSPIRSIADALGTRLAFTTPDSQSGYQSARGLFAPIAAARAAPLFEAVVGPFVTPRAMVEAIVRADADVGALDSYAHDLLCRHEPALAGALRTIARTESTPIPPLVGAADLPQDAAQALRSALLAVGDADGLASTREALLLEGFVAAEASTYSILARRAARADALGYPVLA